MKVLWRSSNSMWICYELLKIRVFVIVFTELRRSVKHSRFILSIILAPAVVGREREVGRSDVIVIDVCVTLCETCEWSFSSIIVSRLSANKSVKASWRLVAFRIESRYSRLKVYFHCAVCWSSGEIPLFCSPPAPLQCDTFSAKLKLYLHFYIYIFFFCWLPICRSEGYR